MELRLQRNPSSAHATTGTLTVDGQFECYTLEDVVRDLGPKGEGKIKDETAIPPGTYPVIINMSPRLKKLMMRLLEVPFFDGILIHSGNNEAHTKGCILVGSKLAGDTIAGGTSTGALAALKAKVQAALDRGEPVCITILAAQPPASVPGV